LHNEIVANILQLCYFAFFQIKVQRTEIFVEIFRLIEKKVQRTEILNFIKKGILHVSSGLRQWAQC